MAPPLKIRRTRPSDLDRILEIERASFGLDAYDRNLFAVYLRTCQDFFLVAAQGPAILGYALACARGARAELVSIAVDPAARSRGIASALMKSVGRRLKLRRVARFSLMVKATNRTAEAVYERHGFTRLRRVRAYYEDGSDGWLMVKSL